MGAVDKGECVLSWGKQWWKSGSPLKGQITPHLLARKGLEGAKSPRLPRCVPPQPVARGVETLGVKLSQLLLSMIPCLGDEGDVNPGVSQGVPGHAGETLVFL